MNINISPPPELRKTEDLRELESWLRQLAVLINLGFSEIGTDNINEELKSIIEGRNME